MDKIKGILVLHASKPGSGRRTPDGEPGIRERKIEEIPDEQLMRLYLCKRSESMCVTKGKCENLDVCAYGKEYVRRMGRPSGGEA